MKELIRLLGYTKRYSPVLAVSVFLMMIAGAMNGALPLLLKPVIDQVLNQHASNARPQLFSVPFTTHIIYLDQVIPFPLHNVWSLVATAILMVFLTKGLTDYCGNYLISFVGFSAVTDLSSMMDDTMRRLDATHEAASRLEEISGKAAVVVAAYRV